MVFRNTHWPIGVILSLFSLFWGKFEHLFSVAMRNFLFVGRTDRGILKRLLDLSKLEVLFKCNDLHLFPVSFNAVSPVSASTGVLATAADPCSNFTAHKAATKIIVKMLTVASASAMLPVCQTTPAASVTSVLPPPTRLATT